MTITWSDDLKVGDKEIDTHHEAFFIKARRIVVACRLSRGGREIEDTVEFMVDYARFHFSAEEARMEALDYPYFESHRNQHAGFLERLDDLRAKLRETGDKEVVARETADFAVDWFIHHIKSSDQPLAEYLRDAKSDA